MGPKVHYIPCGVYTFWLLDRETRDKFLSFNWGEFTQINRFKYICLISYTIFWKTRCTHLHRPIALSNLLLSINQFKIWFDLSFMLQVLPTRSSESRSPLCHMVFVQSANNKYYIRTSYRQQSKYTQYILTSIALFLSEYNMDILLK